MLPGVEVARRRRIRSPANWREPDPAHSSRITPNSSEGRCSRGGNSSSLAHHHHHHHYHHHPSRSAPRTSATSSTQARRLQDLLQEHRAAASQQQNNNLSLLTSSDTSLPPSSSRGFRGLRVDESRLSRLAMLLRGQSNERKLQGAAREARDRLDERLRSTTLAAPRRPTISAPGNALYDASVLFSDTDEDENLWSDDEDWERSMREWLAAWAPSLEDRWQPDLFGGNHRSAAADFQPHNKPREGLSKAAINAIKRETYGLTRVSETSRDQEDCPVCLEKFVSGQALLLLPCNHIFHPDCLTPWLEGHKQCPYCRAHIEGTMQSEPECGGRDILSIQTNDFVSWMSVVEQGMNRLSHGES